MAKLCAAYRRVTEAKGCALKSLIIVDAALQQIAIRKDDFLSTTATLVPLRNCSTYLARSSITMKWPTQMAYRSGSRGTQQRPGFCSQPTATPNTGRLRPMLARLLLRARGPKKDPGDEIQGPRRCG